MIFSHWRVLQCFHFPVAKNMKTLQWNKEMRALHCPHLLSITYGVMTYVYIAIIIIMFIYSSIIDIWDPWILNFHPPVSYVPFASCRAQMTLTDDKSKSAGLKWQQCPQNKTLFLYLQTFMSFAWLQHICSYFNYKANEIFYSPKTWIWR